MNWNSTQEKSIMFGFANGMSFQDIGNKMGKTKREVMLRFAILMKRAAELIVQSNKLMDDEQKIQYAIKMERLRNTNTIPSMIDGLKCLANAKKIYMSD